MDRNAVVVGLDPGGTTGVAIYWPSSKWDHLQLGPMEHHTQLEDLLNRVRPTIVICERFTYQQRDKVLLTPVEYIGVAKLYCQRNHTPFRQQTATQAKNLWTDDKLEKCGLWCSGQRHANDATRHLLYYFTVTCKDLTWVRMLQPD